MSTKVNDLRLNKLCFVCLLYMGVLQRDPIPKLCFAMVLTICQDFSYRYELSQVDTSVLLQVVSNDHLWFYSPLINKVQKISDFSLTEFQTE